MDTIFKLNTEELEEISKSEDIKNYVFRKFKSEKDNDYIIGYPINLGYSEDTIDEELVKHCLESSKDKFLDLSLEPGQDSLIPRVVLNIGIIGINVWSEHGFFIVYKYQLLFANSSGDGFTFKDDDGDKYKCWTPRNGNHTINYNSGEPKIIGVKRS